MRPIAVIAFTVSILFQAASWADDVPDLTKTPGVARSGLTQPKICRIKWGKDERHVTAAMKKEVFALYGYIGYYDPQCVPDAHGKSCEIDHLISRELGGADVVKNLWPEACGATPWNSHLKDKLENRLHKEVCAGHITLKKAREMIVRDWRETYKQYYGEP